MPGFWDKDIRPSSSPDLNPMDFAIWAILERRVCAVPHSRIAALKLALETAPSNLGGDTVRRSCPSAEGRFEAVMKDKGDHIESLCRR